MHCQIEYVSSERRRYAVFYKCEQENNASRKTKKAKHVIAQTRIT